VPDGVVTLEELGSVLQAHAGFQKGLRSGKRVDLRHRDTTGINLTGVSLERAELADANFVRADLRGATFRGANLTRAVFEGCDLRPGALVATARDKQNAGMPGATLDRANLSQRLVCVAPRWCKPASYRRPWRAST